MTELHFFDRNHDYTVVERKLPHWMQPGVISFITFRTNDSIPKAVLAKWRQDRADWLRQHAINPIAADWRHGLSELDSDQQEDFYRTFSTKWHTELDACHGACVLKEPRLAAIVGDSLKYADGEKYRLTDFVVMPNYVHLLCAFVDAKGLLAQCESWKHFTATQINRAFGKKGRFWQQDGFDHLVRSEEQFRYFQKYIADNPRKAGLRSGEALHYSAGV